MPLKKDETTFLINLGEKIAAIRKSKGLKQTEVAYQCNIEKSNLIRIEKGRTNPTVITLCKLTKAMNCTLAELFMSE